MSITKHLKIPSSAITGNCITSTISLLPRSYYNMMKQKHHSSVLARTLRICSKLYIYPFVVGRGHSMFDVRSQPRKKNVNWRDSSPPSIATSALHFFLARTNLSRSFFHILLQSSTGKPTFADICLQEFRAICVSL